MCSRMTVKQAAALMGASEQFIRIGIQQGAFPWGSAVKMSRRWTYFISTEKFKECTGIDPEEANDETLL